MKSGLVRVKVLGRAGYRQVYGTRALVAGEEFELPQPVAEQLALIGKVMLLGPEPRQVAQPKPAAAPQAPDEPQDHGDEMMALREEAHELGVMVDGRWGHARLAAEIRRARALKS